MPIIEGYTLATGSFYSGITASKPSGTGSADLLVAVFETVTARFDGMTIPAGWTVAGSGFSTFATRGLGVMWAAGDVASTTFVSDNSTQATGRLALLRISGANLSAPISAFLAAATEDVAGESYGPSVTAVAGDLVIVGYSQPQSMTALSAPASGYTRVFEDDSSPGTFAVQGKSDISAGATGTIAVGSAADYQARETFTLAVAAGSTGPTWTDIPGATSASYTTSTLTIDDDGAQFRLVATNAGGSVTSNAALLTVTGGSGGGSDGTATPSGLSSTSTTGVVSASGQASVAPAGVSASISVGAPTASGAARASPAGISAAASVGVAVASGATVIGANATPAGVSASASVGAPTASGAARASPAGISAAASVGVAVASGATVIGANATPAGVSVSVLVGAPTASGAARSSPVGVSTFSSGGDAYAFGGSAAEIEVYGVIAYSAWGVTIAFGGSSTDPVYTNGPSGDGAVARHASQQRPQTTGSTRYASISTASRPTTR